MKVIAKTKVGLKIFSLFLSMAPSLMGMSDDGSQCGTETTDHGAQGSFSSFNYDGDNTMSPIFLQSNPACQQEEAIIWRKYNTYPFSLPRDDCDVFTATFSNHPGQQPVNMNPFDSEFLAARIEQVIFKDFPDFEPLKKLDFQERSNPYAIHLFGKAAQAEDGILRFQELLEKWSQNLKKIKHLDISISGLQNGPDGVSTARKGVVGALETLLKQESLREIETLSLRFMNLDNIDLEKILVAMVRPPNEPRSSLQRLVLSFNNLTDSIFNTELRGIIGRLIGDRGNFPNLQILDLRGNRIIDPSQWTSLPSVGGSRGPNFRILMGYNVLQAVPSQIPPIPLSILGRADLDGNKRVTTVFRDRIEFDHPDDLKGLQAEGSDPVEMLKRFYDGCLEGPVSFPKGFLNPASTSYATISDLRLVLWSGEQPSLQRLWSFDLENSQMPPKYLIDLLSSFSPNLKQTITNLVLEKSFKYPQSERHKEEDHINFVKTLHGFENVVWLRLGNNPDIRLHLKQYKDLISFFPKLSLFEFKGNQIGSRQSQNSCSDFWAPFIFSILSSNSIQSLDLDSNELSEEDFGYILGILEGGKGKLVSVFLRKNGFKITEPTKEINGQDNDSIQLLHLLRRLGAPASPPNSAYRQLALVDFSNQSQTTENDAHGFLVPYIKETMDPNSNLPGVGLNGKREGPGNEFTPIQYFGSAKGLLRLSKYYKVGVDAERFVKDALSVALKSRYTSFYNFLEQASMPEKLDERTLSSISEGEGFLEQAQKYFRDNKIPLDPGFLNLSARLYKYKENSFELFLYGPAVETNRVKYIKALPKNELKIRFQKALFTLAFSTQESADVNRETLKAILGEVFG